MRALESDAAEAEIEVMQMEPASGSTDSDTSAPEFENVKARARQFAMIPLWIGILIAVFSSWGIYEIQQSAGMNFWFYCLMFPLFLGIFLIVIGRRTKFALVV
jgi:hypothetical protein